MRVQANNFLSIAAMVDHVIKDQSDHQTIFQMKTFGEVVAARIEKKLNRPTFKDLKEFGEAVHRAVLEGIYPEEEPMRSKIINFVKNL